MSFTLPSTRSLFMPFSFQMILFLIPFHGLRLESISQTLHYWASTLDDAHEDHDHCYDQQYVDQSAQGVELTIPSSQRINSKATIVQSIRKEERRVGKEGRS